VRTVCGTSGSGASAAAVSAGGSCRSAGGRETLSGADMTKCWPQKGQIQQLTVELRKMQSIESVSIYWYDDKGGVQIPVSWNLEYRQDGQWKPWTLYNTDRYNCFPDQFNMVHPAAPVKGDAIRVTMQPKPDSTVGILEMLVE